MMTTLVCLGAGLAIFWIVQLVALMRMPDDRFPGHFDKPIWAATLILTFAVGAIAFMAWRMTAASDREADATAAQFAKVIQDSKDEPS